MPSFIKIREYKGRRLESIVVTTSNIEMDINPTANDTGIYDIAIQLSEMNGIQVNDYTIHVEVPSAADAAEILNSTSTSNAATTQSVVPV